MHTTKPVRTYLDPDAVGPLPRALADDSDALAAARTVLRLPACPTQEICANDMIDVVDPNRRPSSIAPVGYDTAAIRLPRRRLGVVVAIAVGASLLILVAAAISGISGPRDPHAQLAATPPPQQAAIAVPAPLLLPSPAPVDPTVGTLRMDGSLEGQRVYLDGVPLTASAALLRCGPHNVAIGSTTRTRTVDVPCGGEITVYR
jgi:hypothetical protein